MKQKSNNSKCCNAPVMATDDPDEECYFVCTKCNRGVLADSKEPYEPAPSED